MKISQYTIRIICLLFTHFIYAQVPQFNWAIRAGSTGNDSGYGIAVDAFGNTYSTGSFSNTVDFDPGPGTFTMSSNGSFDAYILKTDPNGNFLWAKKLGSGGIEGGMSITVSAAGYVYVTGFFSNTVDFDPGPGVFTIASADGSCNSEIFVLKLDAAGNFVWAKSVWALESICYSLTDVGNSIKTDNNDNVYITGQFQGHADFNTSPLPADTFFVEANDTASVTSDIYILKLNSSGDFKWVRTIGNALFDVGYGVHVSQAGYVYATGLYGYTTDFNPGPGIDTLFTHGSWDCFILKLDTAGNYVWARGIGGSQDDRGFGITTDVNENVYTTGFFTGTVDFDPSNSSIKNLIGTGGSRGIFVLKLNSGGNYVWAKAAVGTSSGGGERSGQSIAIDNFKNTYITGHFNEKVDFNPSTLPADTFCLNTCCNSTNTDAFILKLDSMGNFKWAASMGSTGVDRGTSIFVDQNYNIYTTGYFAGTVDFDPGTSVSNMVSLGSQDIYIQKLSQSFMLGLEDKSNSFNYTIYPNPTRDNVNVILKNTIGNCVISLFDISGRLLSQTTIGSGYSDKNIEVKLDDLSSGLYLFRITTERQIYTYKIIKQ